MPDYGAIRHWEFHGSLYATITLRAQSTYLLNTLTLWFEKDITITRKYAPNKCIHPTIPSLVPRSGLAGDAGVMYFFVKTEDHQKSMSTEKELCIMRRNYQQS